MPTLQEYKFVLQQQHPELDIVTAELSTLGQNSDILVVNNDFIFRFPRYTPGIQQLATEVQLLQALQGKLPLPIPNPQYIQLSDAPGTCWVGYALIPGEPFWREDIHQLSAIAQKNYAQQLGDFLRALHQISKTDLLILSDDDKFEFWQDFYNQIQNKLFQFMRPDATHDIQTHFEAYFNNVQAFAYTPTLRHGDFGTVNILHARTIPTITGVIDFGDAAFGDPALDYAALQAGYGMDFVKLVVNDDTYIAEITPRIEFYIGTYALFEALHGYDNDDMVAFEAGMEQYT